MGSGRGGRLEPPGWRDRMDEAALRTLVQARDEALRLSKLNVPGPRHVLVALLRGGGEVGSRLAAAGVDVDALKSAVEALAGEGRPWSAEPVRMVELSGVYPLEVGTEAAIEAALTSSAERGGDRCTLEDLLLGLVDTQRGTPLGGLLESYGLTVEAVAVMVPPERVPALAARLRPVVRSAFQAGASEAELKRALWEAMRGIYDSGSEGRDRG